MQLLVSILRFVSHRCGSWLPTVCGILLCCPQAAISQARSASESPDRTSQRWLPLPQGADHPDASKQALLLQELRDFVVSQPDQSTLPALSEEQLQQMEQAFRRWREQSGQTRAPDLTGIPREWIDQVLSDPVMRIQAQRMLEQYARDRSLPSPSSIRALLETTGVPFPSGDQSGNRRTRVERQDRSRNGNLRVAPHPLGQPNDRRPELPGFKSNSRPPKRLPTEELRALQNLFEELMAEMPSDQQDSRSQTTNRGKSARGSSARRDRFEPEPRDKKANSTANSTNPSSESPRGTSSVHEGNRTTENPGGRRANAQSSPPRQPPAEPPRSPKQNSRQRSELFNSNSRSSAAPASRRSEESSIRNNRATSKRTTSTSKATPPDRNPQRPSGTNSSKQLSSKAPIELAGLGKTLRRIVAKTLIEQERSQISSNQPRPDQARSQFDGSSRQKPVRPAPSKANAQAKRAKSKPPKVHQAARAKAAHSAGQASPLRSNAASAANSMRELFSDIWKQIAAVPIVSDNKSSTNPISKSLPNLTSAPSLDFSWGSRELCLLTLPALLVIFLSRMRSRANLAQSTNSVEAARAQEILRAGIRTRADVVRAFHHFVLRRQRSVATWWTHRYVARRLSESAPHLRWVIQELTSVYEQARYLPPNVELSRAQIHRVRTALQQCESCSV